MSAPGTPQTQEALSAVRIDGRTIGSWRQPAGEAELAALLAEANGRGQSVIPMGGRSHLDWGNPPRSSDIGLSLAGMDQVVSCRPDDMLLTVQAGCTLHRIQEELAAHRQFLPVDPEAGPESTIGGLVAVNAYGPMRLQHGRLRDHILGIRVVTAEGARTKCGGQVVKNVSGYDLSKFYAGSLGWLGVFTEFHLKTAPLAEYACSGRIRQSDFSALQRIGQQILDRGLAPRSQVIAPGRVLEATDPAGVPEEALELAVQFAGHPESVAWQCRQVSELAGPLAGEAIRWVEESAGDPFWQRISRFGFDSRSPDDVLLKVIAPFSLTADLLRECRAFSERSGRPFTWLCYAGCNLLWVLFPRRAAEDGSWAELASWLETLRRRLRTRRAELILARAPRELKELFEVWGVEGRPLELMLQIKKQLDPKSILNPGRYVGRQ